MGRKNFFRLRFYMVLDIAMVVWRDQSSECHSGVEGEAREHPHPLIFSSPVGWCHLYSGSFSVSGNASQIHLEVSGLPVNSKFFPYLLFIDTLQQACQWRSGDELQEWVLFPMWGLGTEHR